MCDVGEDVQSAPRATVAIRNQGPYFHPYVFIWFTAFQIVDTDKGVESVHWLKKNGIKCKSLHGRWVQTPPFNKK